VAFEQTSAGVLIAASGASSVSPSFALEVSELFDDLARLTTREIGETGLTGGSDDAGLSDGTSIERYPRAPERGLLGTGASRKRYSARPCSS
jgi:hypothetical protein